jgi:hypothetical protein
MTTAPPELLAPPDDDDVVVVVVVVVVPPPELDDVDRVVLVVERCSYVSAEAAGASTARMQTAARLRMPPANSNAYAAGQAAPQAGIAAAWGVAGCDAAARLAT